MARLTNKQAAFVEHYLSCWNGAKAARRAGYSQKTAREIARQNLTKPLIREAIDARLETLKMGSDEVLSRLSEMARADIGDFLVLNTQDIGIGSITSIALNARAFQEKGYLVKSIKDTKDGIHFTMHDSMRALELIGKHHKLFSDLTEHSGLVEIIHSGEIPEKVLGTSRGG